MKIYLKAKGDTVKLAIDDARKFISLDSKRDF